MLSKPSSIVLVIANLLPLAGVLWFRWEVVDILLLYWTESVIIGVINVLRMIASQSGNIISGLIPAAGRVPPVGRELLATAMEQVDLQISMTAIKTFMIAFFIVHYSMFCYGHLSAVVGLFSSQGLSGSVGNSIPALANTSFWISVIAIAVSHLFSYFKNFLGKGEFKRVSLVTLMHRPYGRIMVMHVSIIFGAGGAMLLGNPLPILLVLIIAKTLLDFRMHNKERQSFALD
jgi:hypothetical protein